MFFQLLLLVAGARYAAAQISISANCTAAILSVNSNAAAASCLSLGSLAGLATGGSPIDTIDQWLNTICPAAACSNSTLAFVVNTIVPGCPSELAAAGITDSASGLVPVVQAAYPTLREVACLKNGSTNCVTQTLTALQSSTNQTISISSITDAISNFSSLPVNVACTGCIKASYNIIAQNDPSEASNLQQPLQQKCGTSFTDGSTPSGIVESASTATSSSGSSNSAIPSTGGSLLSVMVGLGLASSVAISSALLVL
ncbi:hypothetical protein M378DRAFT_157970 [Amanita muscaria Koide BX008]|uniref:Uncharacterized protein n=1 Tax=Amanita muscaria (strain Koide BX008) TaxID=946122 RepID=A0A0C2XHC7_AMAMK|nr:hypothetical protein M378DRAFT_157970 [Amanita muscaria Koide BX008]